MLKKRIISVIDSTEEITKFAIINAARSGTSWLCDLLRSHPEIICHKELFHPEKIQFSGPASDHPLSLMYSLKKRNAQPIRFLNEVWKYQTHESKSVGFKIFDGHNEHILHHVIDAPDICIIILRRKDMLASFVSLKVAEFTNIWNTRYERKRIAHDRITIKPDELKKYVNEQNDFFDKVINRLRHAGKHFELLEYEDLQNQPVWSENILKLLNVQTNIVLKSDLVKQRKYELEHTILNYAEIKELLKKL